MTLPLNNEPLPPPNFSEYDLNAVKKYFDYSLQYQEKINEGLAHKFIDHPVWGPIMKSMTDVQRKEQNKKSNERLRLAIYEGKWNEYTNELITQGIVYARMNIPYIEWYELMKLVKDYLMPFIKSDFSNSIEEALTIIDGLSKLTDYAMYGIAEAYFKEKNSIIYKNENKFKTIFESSKDTIYVIDHEHKITMINHVNEGDKTDFIGKSPYDFQDEKNQALTQQNIDMLFKEKKPFVFETVFLNKNKEVHMSMSVSPMLNENKETDSAIIIARDITELKKAEREIKELNAGLEEKVTIRTEELNKINKELESFSYSVSHDLRNPLRAIDGFARILHEDYGTLFDEEGKDAINEIVLNTERMGILIDDLLEFSRLGKQEVIKHRLDMNQLVETVIREMKIRETRKKAILKITHLHEMSGDRQMIKQVIINLLSNAVKYSSKKEKPEIEIGSYKENENVIFYIRDNGAGFDMNYYDKLFSVFQRLHHLNEFKGTGVGLAIVQRVITRHSGKVWAESEVNKGACFYFSIPN